MLRQGQQADEATRNLGMVTVLDPIKKSFSQLLQIAGVLLYHSGLAPWIIGRSARTRVTLYHAIEEHCSSYTEGLCPRVTPDTFAMHLEFYQRYYTVVSMHDYLNNELPEPTKQHNTAAPQLLITFDDGYASVMENALPLLEARSMPATMYLIGNAVRGRMVWVNRINQVFKDYPGQAREVLNTYPDLAKLNRLGVIHRIQTVYKPAQINSLIEKLESTIPNLANDTVKLFSTPDDIRQMQDRGMEFGFHSNDHWNLEQCRDSELVATLATDGLNDLLNSKTFAYPFGYFAPSAIGRLKRQGYAKLMTVGCNNDKFSELHLDRTEIYEPNFARLFARLEVEEPIMAITRAWFGRRRIAAMERTGRGRKRAA